MEGFGLERFPFVALLERSKAAIRREGLALDPALFLRIERSEVYRGDWRVFPLVTTAWGDELAGIDLDENRALCPETWAALSAIDGVTGAGFTWLEPGGELGLHRDPREDNRVRCHVSVVLPPSEAPAWPESGIRLIDTRVRHGVKNDSDAPRITLLVDVTMPFEIPTGAVAGGDP